MKLHFDYIRPSLYSMKLELPYDYNTLIQEFENEPWETHSDRKTTSGLAGDPYSERSGLMTPTSEILQELVRFVGSTETKQQLIETIYQHQGKYFSSLWEGWSKEKVDQYTFWGCIFNRDAPGFHIPVHLDTRLQLATAMIYFVENDDPNQSTYYYTSENQTDPLRIENNFGNGVFHINDHTTWHEGFNRSAKIRYSMICGLLLKV